MNSICIIACYFGKLPEYFDLWYKSCKKNYSVNFLFITDQLDNKIDENIKIINMDINNLEMLASNKLKINNIWLKAPYKICDFRPAFGIIFSDFIKDYDFWGHCDIDMIFGNIREFITEEVLKNNDKILKNGNLSLYRNNNVMNNLFKQNGAIYSYKKVFTTKENYAFDEYTGINKIVKENRIKCFYDNFFVDVDPKYSRFRLVDGENFNNQVFYYENGEIFRAYIKNDKEIKIEKYSHIHFQKRKMKLNDKSIEKNFYINNQGFFNKSKNIEKDDIIKYSEFISEQEDRKELKKYINSKIINFFKYPLKQKIVWVKQKIN